MKKVIIILIIFVGFYFTLSQAKILLKSIPCREPKVYILGTFDKRFNISQAEFVRALSEAEAIWEKPFGIELFSYATSTDEDALPVNLVYDYRQQTTSTLEDIGHAVEVSEASYKALQARYTRVKSEYESLKSAYNVLIDDFDNRSRIYEQHVEAWNNSPRTSKSQFQKLEAEKDALQAQLAEVKASESSLNRKVGEINALVDSLNSLAKSLNLNVNAYNTIGATRGESFTGGIYYYVDGEEGIDIFEFSSREKLVRILAHELGHSLGLEHIDDQKSIMYYLNEGNIGAVSESDRVALKELCGLD